MNVNVSHVDKLLILEFLAVLEGNDYTPITMRERGKSQQNFCN